VTLYRGQTTGYRRDGRRIYVFVRGGRWWLHVELLRRAWSWRWWEP
jgi:hypothetical protein